MNWRPHDNVEINPDNPRGLGICDRCGTPWNHYNLRFEYQWAGQTLRNTNFLVCPECFNPPSPFLQTIIYPQDPPPLINARPFNYGYANSSDISTEALMPIDTEDDNPLSTETSWPVVFVEPNITTETGTGLEDEAGDPITTE